MTVLKETRPRSTDAYTKGGQIFGHVWRMRFENIKMLILWALVSFMILLFFFLTWNQVPLSTFFEFYLFNVVGGHLKIWIWPYVKAIFTPIEEVLKGLAPGAKGFVFLRYTPTDFTTLLVHPETGQMREMMTLPFLIHPWTLAQVAPIHLALQETLLACGAVMGGLLWHFKNKSKKLEKDRILQGQSLAIPPFIAKELKKTKKISPLTLSPDLPWVKDAEVEHLALVGTTGMGKTNTLLHLLNQIRNLGQRAVVVDLTGELVERFYRKDQDFILNPLDARFVSWDIWQEHLAPHEIDAWAAAMVKSNQGDNAIFSESARNLLSFTATQLAEKQEHPEMKHILEWACWKPLDQDTKRFYANSPVSFLMTPEAEKTTAGVRMHLASAIQSFKYLSQEQAAFSITKWVQEEDKDSWLFLSALPSQRATLGTLLAGCASFAFTGLERLGPSFTRRLWFIMDEAPGLNTALTALPRMLAEGRKYGTCVVLGFQNKAQLVHLYNPHVTTALMSNCNTKIVFRCPETETARYMSQLLGQHEVFESQENVSMGAHHMRDGLSLSGTQRMKPVASEIDLMSLDKRQAYIMLPGNLPLTKVTFPLTKTTSLAPPFVPHGKKIS